jgi:hypothetical protein
MSDLLNKASLVVIPSGYKEDTVYSVVPSDGSGDLSFTRASNGTRVNSAGLVEVCPWNLNTNSENFTTGWGTDGTSSATNNFTTAPNGTTTAAKVVANSAGGYAYKTLSVSPNVYTLSLYVKASANTTIDLALNDVGGSGIGSQGFNVTTEWQRIEYDQNITNGSSVIIVYGAMNTGVNYFIWGAQLNIGSTAKPYFPTTDRLNVPRLTYQNGGGGCPSLLLEKQSTNSVFPSEDFSGYSGSAATISTNQATSPDGTTNADLIYPATSGNFAGKYKNIAKSTTGVVSCFVKQASKRYAIIGTDNNATYTCIFDLQTATVVYQATNYTGKIESFGNGWYRISAVYTSSTAADYPFIGVADNSSGGVVVDGTNGLYIWGFQYELNSSYETSYIPTTSASATRVADACFKTGISSLIGQTSGSVFFDFEISNQSEAGNEKVLWYMKDGGTGERYVTAINNGQLVYVEYTTTTIAAITKTGLTLGRHKCAIAYATNDFVFYVDGVQIGTDTSGTPNGYSTFGLQYYTSGASGSQQVNQAIIFPTRLTNAELASLTTI